MGDRNWNSEGGPAVVRWRGTMARRGWGSRNDEAQGRGHGAERIAFKRLIFNKLVTWLHGFCLFPTSDFRILLFALYLLTSILCLTPWALCPRSSIFYLFTSNFSASITAHNPHPATRTPQPVSCNAGSQMSQRLQKVFQDLQCFGCVGTLFTLFFPHLHGDFGYLFLIGRR